ncbi:hypothetical protein CL653_01675 [bacterium]|nr:hypothetical protein [bacterium]
MDIIALLKSKQVIDPTLAESVATRVAGGEDPEVVLLSEGVSEEAVRDGMAEMYGVAPYIPQDEMEISEEILRYVEEESARHYQLIPLELNENVLLVGVNDPENLQLREVLNFVSTKHHITYKLAFVLKKDLDKLLRSYESLTGEVGEALTSLESELDQEIEAKKSEKEGGDTKSQMEHIQEDAPVTKIVATILRYAVDGGASDIHIEYFEGGLRVRFRVDGVLQTSLKLPLSVQSAVVARVKILSSMRLDERRKPQDGRFSATFDGRKIDFRVSVLPTNYGEKVVMRILDNTKGVRTLEDAGISGHNLQSIRRMLKEPFGIILVSGPTGSGKSTTLYAMLSELDKVSKNVLSLEDPVEYNIEGVSQSQVRPEIGYTFASGLRSALRQDPDIILVGEIRDKETAQLAIQAALTGHLVFSTIHTNNAIGVIPRLMDMGVDPYLIAPTLKLAIAQRLSRRLCDGTGKEEPVAGSIKTMIDEEFADLPAKFKDRIPQGTSVMHPEPSPGCSSGTKGRTAVTECLEVTSEIENLILHEGSAEEIYKTARENGYMSMKEDAFIKALNHEIPFEEVSAFGTKVGLENVLTEDDAVDNSESLPETPV